MAGIVVAVGGSLMLAQLLRLSSELQRSLMARSVSAPFACAVSGLIYAPNDLTRAGVRRSVHTPNPVAHFRTADAKNRIRSTVLTVGPAHFAP
ncbi:hypothetical protein BN2475_370087 [Paraburkholderia ribeironis]|uniref:Uncharacterized protein n=1 Tax=Paraburkholderia ribeironis TaxID=1247936 RepID=A0A1N7S565_9BURK|nr:hypothetical protein BN2475_370087 [Paraburkholderia ribeironis]